MVGVWLCFQSQCTAFFALKHTQKAIVKPERSLVLAFLLALCRRWAVVVLPGGCSGAFTSSFALCGCSPWHPWQVPRAAALFSQQAARQAKSHPRRPTSVFLRLPRAAEARFLFVASVGMGTSAADPPWWRSLRCNPEPSGRAFGVSVAPGSDSSSSSSLPVALKELVASPAMQGYCQSSQCCLVDQEVRVCHPRSTTEAARTWPGMGMECPETCVPCLR